MSLFWSAIDFETTSADATDYVTRAGNCGCAQPHPTRSEQSRHCADIEESLATAFEFVGLNMVFLSEQRMELLKHFTAQQPTRYATGLNWDLPLARLINRARAWMTLKGRIERQSWSIVYSLPNRPDLLKGLSDHLLTSMGPNSIDFKATARRFDALEHELIESYRAANAHYEYHDTRTRSEIHKYYDVDESRIRIESLNVKIDGCLVVRSETTALPKIEDVEQVEVVGCFVGHSAMLDTLEHIPRKIGGVLDLRNVGIVSVDGLDSKSEIQGPLLLTYDPQMRLLRVLCVKRGVRFDGEAEAFEDAACILNNHRFVDSDGSLETKKKIYDCQYALIQAGLQKNARW
jgi:hypothetical protein